MKTFRRILFALLLVLVPITLMACSSGGQKTYIKDKDEIIIDYKEEIVHQITMKSSRTFDELQLKDEEQAEAYLKATSSFFEGYEEVFQITSKVENEEVSYELIIDAAKLNESDYPYKNLLYGLDDYTNLKLVEEGIKKDGYTEKK